VDESDGVRASGWALGAGGRPAVPYQCGYSLRCDPAWRTTGLEVRTQGGGWSRTVKLERESGGWRVRASETGRLDTSQPGADLPETFRTALDVDLGRSPLTNTLPIRRLGLLGAAPGTSREVTVAWVEVPTLAVIADTQVYTVLGDGRIGFRSGNFTAELEVDEDGYVSSYPGLARRI
jgi:hypothetical protein